MATTELERQCTAILTEGAAPGKFSSSSLSLPLTEALSSGNGDNKVATPADVVQPTSIENFHDFLKNS